MGALLDACRAEYPAEHNDGHLYRAKAALRDFYKRLDPTNAFNAGIGQASKRKHYRADDGVASYGCADRASAPISTTLQPRRTIAVIATAASSKSFFVSRLIARASQASTSKSA